MQKAEVLLAGLGGQGVQLASDILAEACTLAGRRVSVLPSYGAEARGTLIRAELVISDEEANKLQNIDVERVVTVLDPSKNGREWGKLHMEKLDAENVMEKNTVLGC